MEIVEICNCVNKVIDIGDNLTMLFAGFLVVLLFVGCAFAARK